MRILIVGSGAREHAIARALARSTIRPTLFCCGTQHNPGIYPLMESYWRGDIRQNDDMMAHIDAWQIDLAIIGPEAPLESGLVDILKRRGIPTVGPTKQLAQLETSKIFTRALLKKHNIPGSPRSQAFSNLSGVMDFLKALGAGGYVIKADGLMAGKGVKVAGDHLHSFQEAHDFCAQLIEQGHAVLIEEKLIGQEFSMLCFCDGTRVIPMPLVQDHKRAFVDDKGPNTGGMGSYSDANHSLPFLIDDDIVAAQQINEAVVTALAEEVGESYQGILYGSFMATQEGVKLIEYNVRFGDPEAMNVLAILETDFVELCQALVLGELYPEQVRFKPLATVCKYAVPFGYPDEVSPATPIDVSALTHPEQLYVSGVESVDGQWMATGSRAVAVLGIAPTLVEAERIAEEEMLRIQGALFHRADIGTQALIQHRVEMMATLRQATLVAS